MRMHRDTRTRTRRLLVAAAGLLAIVSLSAEGGDLKRLSAEFQNNTSVGGDGEIFTNAPALPAGAGGVVVYSKTLKVPDDVDVFYVTFSGQGDVHLGSALLMTATVNGALVQPLAGQTGTGGGGPHVQTGWYTLLHLPDAPGVANCNDGGGGSADCHDNTLYFTGCARIKDEDKKKGNDDDKKKGNDDDKKDGKDDATVVIKLANLPGNGGNISWYERATIYIDGQKDERGRLCTGVNTSPH